MKAQKKSPARRRSPKPTHSLVSPAALRAAPDLEAIVALQASSLGYQLIRAGQLWNELAITRVNAEAGGPILREAHTRLFPHLLDEGGVRIVTLAQRVGVTKQAVAPLVQELAEFGFVDVDVDDDDARARRVRLTRLGRVAMAHGTSVLNSVERDLAGALNETQRRALHEQLVTLVAALSRLTLTAASSSSS